MFNHGRLADFVMEITNCNCAANKFAEYYKLANG